MQHFQTHDPLPGDPGAYRRVSPTFAVQMDAAFSVGEQLGRPGDWLVLDNMSLTVVPDEVFQEAFVTDGWDTRDPTPSPPTPLICANP